MKNELNKKPYRFLVSNVLKRALVLMALLHSSFFILHSSFKNILHSSFKNILHSSFISAQEPQKGKASYYSKRATGARTSSGERLHHDSLTCAHRTHPFGTMLKVTNIQNGRSVVVKVTDRGPFGRGRIIDLSYRAARELGMLSQGVAMVTVELANELLIPFKPKDEKHLYEIDFESQPTTTSSPSIVPIWQDLKDAHKKESKPLHKLGDATSKSTTTNTTQHPVTTDKQPKQHSSTSVFDEIDKNPNKSRVSQKRNAK